MTTIFLNKDAAYINRVFPDDVRRQICDLADGRYETVLLDELLNDPGQFAEVKYLFSTWGMPTLTEEQIRTCLPKLECVFYAAGSVQYFARPFLDLGIKVFSAWMANAVPVAEYTVAQILLANKGYYATSRMMSGGEAAPAKVLGRNYPGNYGTPVGILGIGAIGELVCEMLKPFNLKVLAYSRSLTEERAAALGAEKADIDTIFRTCQVVSNHIADNEKTKGIFGREQFASMLPNATFLNTGRGAQVQEDALAEVLAQRPDLTAVLDVTFPEPPLPESPFYKLDNCVLTPHIAGSSGNEVHRMAQYMLEEFASHLKSEPCKYEVTIPMLERMA
ncbi:MAG: hydroxyacid dehydrogenase [Ruminococcaceae bacterium]|nr:hydroxyacid dehydrogenase [Oscillospiraceae bacterium]